MNRRQPQAPPHAIPLHAVVFRMERRRLFRRRWLAGFALLAGLATLIAGASWGWQIAWKRLFTENEYFQIRNFEVTTNGELSRDLILEFAGIGPGQNLMAVRPNRVRQKLLAVPVIADARVGRRLPDTLIIEVSERLAVARLGRPGVGTPLAVDETGHVLGPRSIRATLPVLIGVRDIGLRPGDTVRDPMLHEALQILRICNQAALRGEWTITAIDFSHDERHELALATGEQVWLSRDRLEEKLQKLAIMRRAAREKGLNLMFYDLTVDRNYVGRSAGQNPSE